MSLQTVKFVKFLEHLHEVHAVPLPTVTVCRFLFCHSCLFYYIRARCVSHLYWFPPQNEEVLCSHHHEAHELVAKDLLNLISLQGISFLKKIRK